MQTDDIAAWLTAIWDEQESACREAQEAIEAHAEFATSGTLELRWMLQLRRGGVFQSGWTMPGPPTPAEDLARIAADRKIIEMHLSERGEWCGDAGCGLGEPCRLLRLMASPYADRPGYNPEWRP